MAFGEAFKERRSPSRTAFDSGYQVDFRALSIGWRAVGGSLKLWRRPEHSAYSTRGWPSPQRPTVFEPQYECFLGLFVEGVRHDQRYEHVGVAPARVGYGVGR